MNVRELMERLQGLDPDMPVMVHGLDGFGWTDGGQWFEVEPRVLVPVDSCICGHIEADETYDLPVTGGPITALCIG